MAVYRQVHVSFWQDGFVLDLTPEEKYFYLYLMTNSKTSQCGIYELPKRIIETETGYNRETVEKLLQRFEGYGKIEYNDSTKEIMVFNWLKYNKINSPKVKSCVMKELEKVKYKPFVDRFYTLCKQYGYSIDTITKDYGEEKEEEEEKEEKEKDKSPKKASKKKRAKENLCSLEDVESFVESQMASNPLPVNRKILVKYIDTIRLYRKTARISTNIIKKEWQKWQRFHPDVITYALWVHVEKHDDKPESYTLAIMRNTKEYEAKRGILILKNKAKEATKDEISQIQPGRDQTEDTGFEGGGYYDQFDIFA
jgi:phage gp36-like protein